MASEDVCRMRIFEYGKLIFSFRILGIKLARAFDNFTNAYKSDMYQQIANELKMES